MKSETKYEIIVWSIIIVICGLFVLAVYVWFANDFDNYNICAEQYGYEEVRFWSWEGTTNLNYTHKYFNQTHIACCEKTSFIDGDGQVQRSHCTGAYPK